MSFLQTLWGSDYPCCRFSLQFYSFSGWDVFLTASLNSGMSIPLLKYTASYRRVWPLMLSAYEGGAEMKEKHVQKNFNPMAAKRDYISKYARCDIVLFVRARIYFSCKENMPGLSVQEFWLKRGFSRAPEPPSPGQSHFPTVHSIQTCAATRAHSTDRDRLSTDCSYHPWMRLLLNRDNYFYWIQIIISLWNILSKFGLWKLSPFGNKKRKIEKEKTDFSANSIELAEPLRKYIVHSFSYFHVFFRQWCFDRTAAILRGARNKCCAGSITEGRKWWIRESTLPCMLKY